MSFSLVESERKIREIADRLETKQNVPFPSPIEKSVEIDEITATYANGTILKLKYVKEGKYVEKETKLVFMLFKNDFICIGSYENEKVVSLTVEKIKICKNKKYKYLSEKLRFIQSLLSGELVIFGRSKEEILKNMDKMNFDRKLVNNVKWEKLEIENPD